MNDRPGPASGRDDGSADDDLFIPDDFFLADDERSGSMRAYELPMFPLGSVLFPGMGLPLRIFEPRYRALLDRVLAGDGRFGVTLIERGWEVGGGDIRAMVGTVAQVVQVQPQPDGTAGVLAVGVHRIRVTEWLPDAPYPVARVTDFPDDDDQPNKDRDTDRDKGGDRGSDLVSDGGDALGPAGASGDLSTIELGVRRLLINRGVSEQDLDTIEFSPDPQMHAWQLCALAPVGPFDQHRMLAASGVGRRLVVLRELLAEAHERGT